MAMDIISLNCFHFHVESVSIAHGYTFFQHKNRNRKLARFLAHVTQNTTTIAFES